VLELQRAADPEMDQELYSPDCMLQIHTKGTITGMGRLSWMDGSEGDDEDQNSRILGNDETESQPRPVSFFFII
jgi:hypothetical protein